MADYRRATRECAFTALRPELVEGIRQHINDKRLGNLEPEILICGETTSEKLKKSGFFSKMLGGDPDTVHYSAVVVTPKWFIGAISGAKRGTTVVSIRLAEVEAQDFESKLVEDYGFTTFGLMSGFSERVQMFWGLGRGAASDHLKQVFYQAIEQANTSS